jgi:cytochrome c-type biogenesis protein CcmH
MRGVSLRTGLLVAALVLNAAAARAVQPDEMLGDPALEARARALGKELRCLVCQNQSIDDSDADLARDLRILLRQRLTAGDSDDQARKFLVDRYGDYVLLKPPFKTTTLALWLGPLALLLAGGGIAVAYARGRVGAGPLPLSDEERRRADALLRETDAP